MIQKLGLKPRRTIRLALWAAEEQGLLGSRAYVARHFFDTKMKSPKPGHENVQAYFNLDNGTGRILGIWGQGNTGAMKNFEQWGQALKDIGWKNVSPRSVTQTDHGSFEEAGIPGFQFIQERLEYNSRTHHSNMDTFDHVQKDDVIQQGAVAAVFAWYAANTPEKLPRKPMPAPQAHAVAAGAGRERHGEHAGGQFRFRHRDNGSATTVLKVVCRDSARCFHPSSLFAERKPLELTAVSRRPSRGTFLAPPYELLTGSVPPQIPCKTLKNDAPTPFAGRGHAGRCGPDRTHARARRLRRARAPGRRPRSRCAASCTKANGTW